jgi:REP element-mobilizing transposase RayT
MPRTARAAIGGFCYHVLNRGNGRAQVFHHDADYHAFVKLLQQAVARTSARLISHCLIPNHFHLALWPVRDDDLALFMHWLLTTQAGRYRKQYQSTGHVWQGRFRAFPIQDDEHLLCVLRYIERIRFGPAWWRGRRIGVGPVCAGTSSRCCFPFCTLARYLNQTAGWSTSMHLSRRKN